MRRLALRGALLAMVSTVILLPGGPGHAAPVVPSAASAAAPRPTNFGLHAMGYGTLIKGGQIPASSGATGFAHIACTTLAGIDRSNGVANVTIPGLGEISTLETNVQTKKKGKTVTAVSRHVLAGITLAEAELGSLELGAVESTAKVWHNATGFHSEVDTKVAGIVLTRPGEDPQVISIPTPGQPVEIPGLLRITIGETHVNKKAHSIFARAQGLFVEILPTNTKVKIALSRARMTDEIVNSIMSGFAAGFRGKVLDPVLRIGANPFKNVPCEGSGGKIRSASLVGLDIPSALNVDAAKVRVFGNQVGRRRARAWTEATIAHVSLGGGAARHRRHQGSRQRAASGGTSSSATPGARARSRSQRTVSRRRSRRRRARDPRSREDRGEGRREVPWWHPGDRTAGHPARRDRRRDRPRHRQDADQEGDPALTHQEGTR